MVYYILKIATMLMSSSCMVRAEPAAAPEVECWDHQMKLIRVNRDEMELLCKQSRRKLVYCSSAITAKPEEPLVEINYGSLVPHLRGSFNTLFDNTDPTNCEPDNCQLTSVTSYIAVETAFPYTINIIDSTV